MSGEVIKATEQQLEQIHTQSDRNNSVASMPMDLSGKPIDTLAVSLIENKYTTDMQGRALQTGYQARAIFVGDGEMYKDHMLETPTFEKIDLSDYKFLDGLQNLPQEGGVYGDYSRAATIDRLRKCLAEVGTRVGDEPVYSHYYAGQEEDSQLEVTDSITQLRNEMAREVEGFADGNNKVGLLNILENPVRAVTVNSVTVTHELPSTMTFSTDKGDFDAGNCDMGLADSSKRGDSVFILATRGKMLFVANEGVNGWVKATDVAAQDQVDAYIEQQYPDYQKRFLNTKEPVFYQGSKKNATLLPGDVVHVGPNGEVMVLENDGGVVTSAVLPDTNLPTVERLDSPQEFVDAMREEKTPYLWAVNDCAQALRKRIQMMGRYIRKYSADMREDMAQAFHNELSLKKTDHPEDALAALQAIEDGIYLVEMAESDGTSTHIFLDTVKDGEHHAASYAFLIRNDQGKTDVAIGAHECGIPALAGQINERDRELIFVQMAERRNTQLVPVEQVVFQK